MESDKRGTEAIKAAFSKADVNGDGKLSLVEFQHLFRQLSATQNDFQPLFKIVDTDNSGFVDACELINYIFSTQAGAESLIARAEAEAEKQIFVVVANANCISVGLVGEDAPRICLPSLSDPEFVGKDGGCEWITAAIGKMQEKMMGIHDLPHSFEGHELLLIESEDQSMGPLEGRRRWIQIAFESMKVSSLLMKPEGFLAMFASQTLTGVAVKICKSSNDGYSAMIVPIVEGTRIQHAVSEMMLPDLSKKSCNCLGETVFKAINSCEEGDQRDLWESVVLHGLETSQLQSILEFISQSQKIMKAKTGGQSVNIQVAEEGDMTSWTGGAMMASLDSAKAMFVSSEDYDADGTEVIWRFTA